MRILLLLIAVAWMHQTQAQEIRNLLFNTQVSYHNEDKTMRSNSFDHPGIRVYNLIIHSDYDVRHNKINEQIQSYIDEFLNSEQEFAKFENYYSESLRYDLSELVKNEKADEEILLHLNEFELEISYMTVEVYTLSDEILTVAFTLQYDAANYEEEHNDRLNELAYRTYQSYNIRTGEREDLSSVISKNKTEAFRTLIRKSIPEHFQNQVSDEEIANGLPVFQGASFYYNVQGNGSYLDNFCTGIPNVCIRLDLETIKPFLNDKGPYKKYLQLAPATPAFSHFENRFYLLGYYGEEQYFRIRRIQEFVAKIPSGTGFRRSVAKESDATNGTKSGIDTRYRKDGLPESQVEFHFNGTRSAPDDSVHYEYTGNTLTAVEHFEFDSDTESYSLKSLVRFDTQGNILEEHDFTYAGNWELDYLVDEAYYYTYFDEYVIEEAFISCERGDYLVQAHDLITTYKNVVLNTENSESSKNNTEMRIEESEISILHLRISENKTDTLMLYSKVDGKVVSMEMLFSQYDVIEYNEQGFPVFYKSITNSRSSQGPILRIQTNAEYNDQGLPLKLRVETGSGSIKVREYFVEYFKK